MKKSKKLSWDKIPIKNHPPLSFTLKYTLYSSFQC